MISLCWCFKPDTEGFRHKLLIVKEKSDNPICCMETRGMLHLTEKSCFD